MPILTEPHNKFYDNAWVTWNDMIHYSPAPRFRRKKILNWIKKYSFGSLLDVGCGNGEFLSDVQKILPSKKLIGVDVSEVIICANRNMFPKMDFYLYDLDTEDLSEQFDIVVCMEVIEHCSNYRSAIHKLTLMTKHVLVISVPCGPMFEIDKRVGHVRHFKLDEIRDILSREGFDLIRVQSWGFPFFNFYKHLINLNPNKMSEQYLNNVKYSRGQKFLAFTSYILFHLCLPFFGYQLFAIAVYSSQKEKDRNGFS
ncbi:MAG: class I SAM-dependent methyltransferase [Candidatus Helarchaeota archaeon]|nr:class I SAM-dependent methyltransferase [Candidatus Helarchaeota archaeon]